MRKCVHSKGAYMSIVVQGVKRDVYPGVRTSYVVYVIEYFTLCSIYGIL